MKQLLCLILGSLGLLACSGLKQAGKHYQRHQDYQSLRQVVDQLSLPADTLYVQKLLGKPIDMGFDYRYLLDSVGPMDCVVGAVFHIGEDGMVDDKWIGEICE